MSATVTVVKSVDFDKVVADATTNFLGKAALKAQRFTVQRSPVDTGMLRSSIQIESHAPEYVKVGSDKTHGLVLEESDRTHYVSGNTAWTGQPTKGWFKAGIEQAREALGPEYDGLGLDIKKGWESGH